MIDIKDIKYKETTRHGKLVKNKFYRHTCDSWFVYSSTKDEAFKNSWALNNLQPMWASENRSKGARFASCRK